MGSSHLEHRRATHLLTAYLAWHAHPEYPRVTAGETAYAAAGAKWAALRGARWPGPPSIGRRTVKLPKPKATSAYCVIPFLLPPLKTLAQQGPKKLPKLDVAGSTPVARSS